MQRSVVNVHAHIEATQSCIHPRKQKKKHTHTQSIAGRSNKKHNTNFLLTNHANQVALFHSMKKSN